MTFVAHRWFGRKVAGLSLVCMVFLLCGNWPSWAVTTFSPWLFTANFAQGIFLFAVAVVPSTFERPSRGRVVRLGVLLGIVALTHTAPTVLLAVLIATAALWSHRRKLMGTWEAVRSVAAVAVVAIAVSSPFWMPIVLRYRLKVRNPGPSGWTWDQITPHAVAGFVGHFVGRWPFVLLALGLPMWIKHRTARLSELKVVVLVAWTAWSAFGFVASTYRATHRPGAAFVPNLVPSYHWLLYLSLALCVWFGLAVAAVADWAALRVHRANSSGAVAAMAALIAVAVSVPAWRTRQDLRGDGRAAREMVQSFEDFRASTWIAENTTSKDTIVYAGSDPAGLIVVGLSGRRSLVVNELFSNPFVDWERRDAARVAIVDAVERCDLAALSAAREPFGSVPLLVRTRDSASEPAPAYCPAVATVALETQAVTVFRLQV
jgi:hypothetical protein